MTVIKGDKMSDETTRTIALTRGPDLAPEQIHRARLFVANQARDAEDCAELLDMLGLNGRPIRVRKGKGRAAVSDRGS